MAHANPRQQASSIEASKKSGLWHFVDAVDALIIPKDLEEGLKSKPEALAFFVNTAPFVTRWLELGKTEKTRLKRIDRLVAISVKEERLPGS